MSDLIPPDPTEAILADFEASWDAVPPPTEDEAIALYGLTTAALVRLGCGDFKSANERLVSILQRHGVPIEIRRGSGGTSARARAVRRTDL